MDTPIRLRRLEVQGFKSFATRTVFEFGPGITAIVGPNGSGKSNLADALRWALGEQNPRTMRLRRLEDVIFAGGGKRAQAGFAEVNLVLDNGDGWLPLEFSEVAVTRRLHRSGESEYLLNRRRVRLRDILDLFLKARLGQNSYAILGQGMVDMVLSLRSEERRGLIEEAADVRRHRLKIEEALDQLAATRENRDRIELLIGEIGPRLAQLERQARRAAQHATLSQTLAGQLQQLYATRARAIWSDAECARTQHAAAVAAAEQASAALAGIETRLEGLRQQLAGARADERRLEERWSALNQTRLQSERRLGAVKDRLPYFEARRAELDSDLAALERERQELAAETPAQSVPGQMLEEADAAVVQAQQQAQRVRSEVDQRRRDLEACEHEIRRVQAGREQAQERVTRLREQAERLQAERMRLDQRAGVAREKVAAWAREFREVRMRAAEQERRVLMAGGVLAEARRRAELAVARERDAATAAAAADALVEQTQRRLDLLTGQQDARRPAEEVLVALLDALRGAGPGRPRVLGILGGLIRVQEGLEVAIEAALAESLNGLVVRTEREALEAVRVLQEIQAGRLTFFALESTRASHPVNLSAGAGTIGVAADLVQCEPEYRALVDLLLGRMIVVDDVETAARTVRRDLGSAVTLDGTVLHANGAISGGRGKADGDRFRLDRELSGLRQSLALQEEQRVAAHGRLASAREAAAAATERAAGTERDLNTAERGRAGAERAQAELHRRFAIPRGELEWIRAQRAELVRRTEATAAELAEAEAATPPERDSEQALERQRLDLREAFLRAQRAQTEATNAVSEARGRVAALQAERASIETLHRSRAEARLRTERAIVSREEALQALSLEQADAVAQAKRLEHESQQAAEDVSRAQESLECARQRTATQAAEEQQLAADLAAARATAAAGERARLDAELALARANEALDHLEQELQAEGIAIDRKELAEDAAAEAPAAPLQDLETRVRSLRRQIRELGAINEEAEADYRASKERHEFLTAQVADLQGAETTLMDALAQLRGLVREQFRATFQTVNADFQIYFRLFFGGGQARLALAEPEDYGESGVDIIAQPPGKRLQNLAMLSGGERSMTAVALLFALLESNPAPFCVLDEVDAALDEANVGRFSDALARLAGRSQFLVITHNRGTVQAADQIYGVSMAGDGVSNVLSMRLSEAAPLLA